MSILGNIANRIWGRWKGNPDQFLRYVSGVVHVGANTGQERELYDHFGLRVIWIEPIPRVFEALVANIMPFPRQRALRCLVTDQDDVEYLFHVANNDGRSSSILEIKHHADIWPEVNYLETISIRSTTLAALFEKERIVPTHYRALIMDTQGSELLVLKGSIPVLRGFEYIKTEVCDFEAYAGCCQLSDIDTFMKQHGYAEISRRKFANRPQGGSYFDVTYRKKAWHRMFWTTSG